MRGLTDRLGVLGVAFAVLPGALACAQDGLHPHDHHHTRHEHPHHDDLPVVRDGDRFFTNRESRVGLDLPREDDAFFFVVYGDRTGGPANGVAVLKDAVRDTNLLEPDLVMTVGDLINGYNQTDEWMEEMREFRGIMDRLVCPWFPVAGNHDVYWRGPNKPEGEHEHNYEMHFGPLWYAFDHKGCRFIALYSDEGDPATGEKDFNKPDAQRMSEAQFGWLRGVLEGAKDKRHVFVFLHHPRWRGANYGEDWERVHELLVEAGNVRAVFAGHIHRMDYSARDGIEYVALATVGGHQPATVPDAGFLHHYNIVTVRDDRIGMSAIPVGAAIDPREITDELRAAAERVAGTPPKVGRALTIADDGSAGGILELTLENPTPYELDVTVTIDSGDSRWVAGPDHEHARIPAGGSKVVRAVVSRSASGIDGSFRPVEAVVDAELLTRTFRYRIPTSRTPVPIDASGLREPEADADMALATGGERGGHVSVPSAWLPVPDGAFTVECRMRAESFGRRVGLIAKTESSDYGIFVSDGVPEFSVFLGERYVTARAGGLTLETGRWYHVAGVYDGERVRLYVDGKEVASAAGAGARRTNDLPFIIGGDVDRSGRAVSLFAGLIDDVRVSEGARYAGDGRTPKAIEADARTLLMLDFDARVGPWVFDRSSSERRVMLRSGAGLERAAQ